MPHRFTALKSLLCTALSSLMLNTSCAFAANEGIGNINTKKLEFAPRQKLPTVGERLQRKLDEPNTNLANGVDALKKKLSSPAATSLDTQNLLKNNLEYLRILVTSNVLDVAPTPHELMIILQSVMQMAQNDFIFDPQNPNEQTRLNVRKWRSANANGDAYTNMFEDNIFGKDGWSVQNVTENHKAHALHIYILLQLAKAFLQPEENQRLNTYGQTVNQILDDVLGNLQNIQNETIQGMLNTLKQDDPNIFETLRGRFKTILMMDDNVFKQGDERGVSNAYKDVFDAHQLDKYLDSDKPFTMSDVKKVLKHSKEIKHFRALLSYNPDLLKNFETDLEDRLTRSALKDSASGKDKKQGDHQDLDTSSDGFGSLFVASPTFNKFTEHHQKAVHLFLWQKRTNDLDRSEESSSDEEWSDEGGAKDTVEFVSRKTVKKQLQLLEKYALDYIVLENKGLGEARHKAASSKLQSKNMLQFFKGMREATHPSQEFVNEYHRADKHTQTQKVSKISIFDRKPTGFEIIKRPLPNPPGEAKEKPPTEDKSLIILCPVLGITPPSVEGASYGTIPLKFKEKPAQERIKVNFSSGADPRQEYTHGTCALLKADPKKNDFVFMSIVPGQRPHLLRPNGEPLDQLGAKKEKAIRSAAEALARELKYNAPSS